MSAATILLGYEVGHGRAVRIPVRHMAVTGITQQSGKTTTLEALIGRSGLRAVSFVTKRGESSFSPQCAGRQIPAFFLPSCDWRSATALLQAHLGETLSKSLRPYLMMACSGTPEVDSNGRRPKQKLAAATTLADVAVNLEHMENDFASNSGRTACFTLGEYFAGLLAELETVPFATTLELGAGLSIMDISGYSLGLQGLAIGSTLDWISEHESGIITIIPEAWEFIPREGDTPCKQAVIRMARKGGCLDNFVWIDSQDLASIDIEVRKMCSVYLLGVQRERNEVLRTLNHIPASLRKPTAKAIMELQRGEFWAVFDQEMRCCYVQPPWLDQDPERAREYAQFSRPASFVAPPRARKNINQPSGDDGAGSGIADAIGPAPEPLSGSVQ
jgi:hypothetical protein